MSRDVTVYMEPMSDTEAVSALSNGSPRLPRLPRLPVLQREMSRLSWLDTTWGSNKPAGMGSSRPAGNGSTERSLTVCEMPWELQMEAWLVDADALMLMAGVRLLDVLTSKLSVLGKPRVFSGSAFQIGRASCRERV